MGAAFVIIHRDSREAPFHYYSEISDNFGPNHHGVYSQDSNVFAPYLAAKSTRRGPSRWLYSVGRGSSKVRVIWSPVVSASNQIKHPLVILLRHRPDRLFIRSPDLSSPGRFKAFNCLLFCGHMGVVTLGFIRATEVGYSCALIMVLGHGLS